MCIRDRCTVLPELDTDCSVIWIKLLTLPAQAVYICAYYRPDVSDEESLKQFETSVRRATTSRNAQILVAGDMNFPGPDWISDSDAVSIKPLSPYPRLSQRFLDLTADIGLEQVVHEATREGNTFDLVLTNRPDLVPRVETVSYTHLTLPTRLSV